MLCAPEIVSASLDAMCGEAALEIVSVHQVCLNCSDAEGRRWTILTDEREFLPRAVCVKELPHATAGETIRIDAGDAEKIFDPTRYARFVRPRWAALICEWRDLLRDGDLDDLAEAVETGTPLAALSGLGPGFTPAGDDFITGWVTARQVGRASGGNETFEQFCSEWTPEWRRKTNWFSGWMIRDAMRGAIWQRGVTLLNALAGDDAEQMLCAVSAILEWGHTSGRAWLAGFAHGLEI